MQIQFCSVIVALAVISTVYGARILGSFPFPGKSHMIMNRALMVELARRGHDVTVINAFPMENPPPNYKDIYVPPFLEQALAESFNKYEMENTSLVSLFSTMIYLSKDSEEKLLNHENILTLLNSEEKFDLLIHEATFMDTFLALGHKFDTPIVLISSNVVSSWLGGIVGNPYTYTYIPEMVNTITDRMTFFQRLSNMVAGVSMNLVKTFLSNPRQDELIRKYFNFTEEVTTSDLEKRVCLIIGNSHFSLNFPRPNVPNVIEGGGLHISKPKPLPTDIQHFLDSSKNGVIYFSMGSHIRSADMPVTMKTELMKAFSQLKQNILWKWEEDSLPGMPNNLKIAKWLPQNDILAHPNIVVFISHGGLLSSQEAVYHGVPIIGIPVFGDQISNSAKAMARGYGIQIRMANVTSQSIIWAVNEILSNPRYKERVMELSRRFKDRPISPLDEAVFWTEYVIRHKGAPHLRSAALDLTWYQFFALDILAFVVSISVSAIFVIYLVVKKGFAMCYTKSKTKENKNKKSN